MTSTKRTKKQALPPMGTPEQRAFLTELVGDSEDDLALVLHLLRRQLAKPKALRRYVPLPTSLIRKKFRRADLTKLRGNLHLSRPSGSNPFGKVTSWNRTGLSSGVLDRTRYDAKRRRCRYYRVRPWVVREFIRKGNATVEEASRVPRVNLVTGKATTKTARSRLSDEHNNAYPELVQGALRDLEFGRFDAPAVEAYLASQERSSRTAVDGDAFEWGRYWNDRRCYGSVLLQAPFEGPDGVWRYRLAYVPTRTGRITQIGGGLQAASKHMKEVAYSSIVGLRNYDLTDSQPRGMRQYAEDWGVPMPRLSAYLDTPNAKARAAHYVGVERDGWKEAFIALSYGAVLIRPDVMKELVRKAELWARIDGGDWTDTRAIAQNTVVSALAAGCSAESFPGIYDKFYHLASPFYEEFRAWRRYLDEEYAPREATRSRWGRNLRNACGMPLYLDKITNTQERQRKAAAHLLQGLEAAFVHALTTYLTRRGVPVISNEHDGLVVVGEVSEDAIEEAKQESGYRDAVLRQKPFV